MNEESQSSRPLAGEVVLVTRPAQQAAGFIQMIRDEGGSALDFPTIEIQALALTQHAADTLLDPQQFDLLIFISANAVRYAADAWQSAEVYVDKIQSKMAVIGRATRRALEQLGRQADITSHTGFDSESLLSTEALQSASISAKRILIIKGQGGRKTLQDVLKERGAHVETVDVYIRRVPKTDAGMGREFLMNSWPQQAITAITVTSNESLQNLYDMVKEPGRVEMLKTAVIVPSERSESLARELGFSDVCLSTSAHDHDMLEALIQCKNNHK